MNPALLRHLWLGLAAGMLLVAGHLLTAWWTHLTEAQMPLAGMMPHCPGSPIGPSTSLQVYTDRGHPVLLTSYPEQPPPLAETLASEEQWLRASGLSLLLTRTAPPTSTYVCHDWVFTGGRYAMLGDAVDKILEDNGYQEIPVPLAGDLVVYRSRGAASIMHTGIVHTAEESGVVLVESKWAWMGRYVHPAGVYCHPEPAYTYHRSPRPGHLLRGIDSPEPAKPGLSLATPRPRPGATDQY